jgi:hypothetical protein
MFDDLYREDVERALRTEAQAPRIEPKPEPGVFTGLGGAAWRGVAQGAVETGRAALNLLEAYGKSYAYTEGAPREESIDRMFEQSEASKALGRTARSLDIDPETTGTAGQIVHGLTKFGSKAVGYGLTMGPLAPVGFGVDEGISEGLRLSDKGADTQTALTAGLIHGGAAAASIALPVAGKTIPQTIGLTAVGGPGAFMGEQATIREILDSAGHADIAREYDPFDVTGLVVSTLGPGAFGAGVHAARGMKARRAAAKPGDVPAPEIAASATGDVAPDAPRVDADAYPREAVDAALVLRLVEVGEDAALVKRTDVAGMRQHVDAVRAAEDAINAGKAPDVSVIARADPEIVASRGVDTAAPAARQAAGALETAAAAPDVVQSAAEPLAARAAADVATSDATATVRASEPTGAGAGQLPTPASRDAVERGMRGGRPAEPALVDQLSERVKAIEVQTDDGAKVAGMEVARQADAEVRATEKDANVFEAAVRCFINMGA